MSGPRRHTVLITVAALGVALGTAVLAVEPAAADPTCTTAAGRVTCTYAYTGAEQTYAVPAGVTSVRIQAQGSDGGRGGIDDPDNVQTQYSPGGHGGVADATVSVTPGQTLYVEVGGKAFVGDSGCNLQAGAECNGGWNGGGSSTFGGGGGGASDVRSVSRTASGTLESRLAVAAGGGGGGSTISTPGGAGGDAGSRGSDGVSYGTAAGGQGGGAGTLTAGGAGGIGPSPDPEENVNGEDGTLGEGGDGGCPCGGDGGGGGGGYYGGGGGSEFGYDPGPPAKFPGSGGGGGGSNYAPGGSAGAGAGGVPAQVVISYALAVTTISTQASGSVALGGSIRDTATLGNAVNPTGNVYFAVYGPNDATCANEAAATFTVAANGSTTVQSGNFTPSSPGVYRWIAVYGGDTLNAPASGVCNAANESVTVTDPNRAPTIRVASGGCSVSQPGRGGVVLAVGDPDGDTVTVSVVGNTNPTLMPPGSVTLSGSGTFRLLTVSTARADARGTLTLRASDGRKSTDLTETVISGPTRQVASLNGTSGNDLILARNGVSAANAGAGDDVVCGSDVKDGLDGGPGLDVVEGRGGSDTLNGGTGPDALVGDAGNDTLTGGTGPDFFSGGSGTDRNTDYRPAEGDVRDGT